MCVPGSNPEERSTPGGVAPPLSPTPSHHWGRPSLWWVCNQPRGKLERAKKASKHTSPALSHVLYFPEVMARGWERGEKRKTERARAREERGQ